MMMRVDRAQNCVKGLSKNGREFRRQFVVLCHRTPMVIEVNDEAKRAIRHTGSLLTNIHSIDIL